MKILITGGAGYKGIILTKYLLDQGHNVTVLDNFMYGYEPILHLATHPGLTIQKADIRNKIEGINKFDVIYHLAGISGFPACAANQNSAQLINVDASRDLVRALSVNQILIYASTTSLYGKSGQPCDENTPVDPVSTYAMTKLAAENIIMEEKENAISLRFATIFGFSPKMRSDLMVNDFTYRAVKEGTLVLFDSFAKRTFMHVTDAAKAYLFALKNYDFMKGGIYNAGGNDFNFSKLEVAERIRQKIDFKIIDSEIKDKDLRHFIVNFGKIENLGFKPTITLEDGIDELIKVFSFYEYYSPYRTI
jgi:nucleoside-diphosphate-sugar epimerase